MTKQISKMKFNKTHESVMKTAFDNYNRLIELEQKEWFDNLMTVMGKIPNQSQRRKQLKNPNNCGTS